jgi:ABC-2 type transport system permease protein
VSLDRVSMSGPGVRRLGWVNWIGVWTLYRREVLRASRNLVDGLFGPLLTNLLFLAVFRLALGDAEWPVPGISLVGFVAPALILFAVAERALTATSGSILFDKYTGTLGDLTMAPLSPLERLVGYAAGAATAGLMTGAVLAALLLPLARITPAAPLAALGFAAATGFLFALIGIVVGLWSTRWDHYTVAHSFLFIPPAYFSGMFFPVGGMPELGRFLVRLNPFYYGLDGFRQGLAGWREGDPATDAAALVLLILAVGLLAYRLVWSGYRVKA